MFWQKFRKQKELLRKSLLRLASFAFGIPLSSPFSFNPLSFKRHLFTHVSFNSSIVNPYTISPEVEPCCLMRGCRKNGITKIPALEHKSLKSFYTNLIMIWRPTGTKTGKIMALFYNIMIKDSTGFLSLFQKKSGYIKSTSVFYLSVFYTEVGFITPGVLLWNSSKLVNGLITLFHKILLSQRWSVVIFHAEALQKKYPTIKISNQNVCKLKNSAMTYSIIESVSLIFS